MYIIIVDVSLPLFGIIYHAISSSILNEPKINAFLTDRMMKSYSMMAIRCIIMLTCPYHSCQWNIFRINTQTTFLKNSIENGHSWGLRKSNLTHHNKIDKENIKDESPFFDLIFKQIKGRPEWMAVWGCGWVIHLTSATRQQQNSMTLITR